MIPEGKGLTDGLAVPPRCVPGNFGRSLPVGSEPMPTTSNRLLEYQSDAGLRDWQKNMPRYLILVTEIIIPPGLVRSIRKDVGPRSIICGVVGGNCLLTL